MFDAQSPKFAGVGLLVMILWCVCLAYVGLRGFEIVIYVYIYIFEPHPSKIVWM
jgi:predicted membrane protein